MHFIMAKLFLLKPKLRFVIIIPINVVTAKFLIIVLINVYLKYCRPPLRSAIF